MLGFAKLPNELGHSVPFEKPSLGFYFSTLQSLIVQQISNEFLFSTICTFPKGEAANGVAVTPL